MRPLIVLAIVVLVATGCRIGPVPGAGEPTPDPPSLVAIPTAEPPGPNAGCMEALMTGVLVADDDAGIVVEAADGTSTLVVWPHGWAAVDQDGMRILLNDRGDPIARVGDHVSIGGGQGPDGRWHTCGEVTRLP